MGAAGADGVRRGRRDGTAPRSAFSAALAAGRRAVGPSQLYGAGLSERVLSALPRLLRLLPALGPGPLSPPGTRRQGRLNVTGVVTALEFEARSLGGSGDGALIRVSGIGAEHASHAAQALVAAGARAL